MGCRSSKTNLVTVTHLSRLRPDEFYRGVLIGKGAYCNVYELLTVGEPPDDLAFDFDICAKVISKYDKRDKQCWRLKTELLSIRPQVLILDSATSENPTKIELLRGRELFNNEISILKTLHNGGQAPAGIIEVIDAWEERDDCVIVMRHYRGGELFSKVVGHKRHELSELVVARWVRILMEAVAYCHDQDIIHRDIKLENVLLPSSAVDCVPVICDFGMGAKLPQNAHVSTGYIIGTCGSRHYLSPEQVQGLPYGKPIDVWALGVLIYLLLFWRYPWDVTRSEHNDKLCYKIINTEPSFFDSHRQPSIKAIDLLKKMLTKDPRGRITAREALKTEWLTVPLNTIN